MTFSRSRGGAKDARGTRSNDDLHGTRRERSINTIDEDVWSWSAGLQGLITISHVGKREEIDPGNVVQTWLCTDPYSVPDPAADPDSSAQTRISGGPASQTPARSWSRCGPCFVTSSGSKTGDTHRWIHFSGRSRWGEGGAQGQFVASPRSTVEIFKQLLILLGSVSSNSTLIIAISSAAGV